MDTRYTKKNLREIMLLAGKFTINDVEVKDSDVFPYFPRPEEDEW